MTEVIYNPIAGEGRGLEHARAWAKANVQGPDCRFTDITKVSAFDHIESLPEGVRAVIAGGDGTLNRLANDVNGRKFTHPVDYVATGSGNDFQTDTGISTPDKTIRLNEQVENAPCAYANGRAFRFINGVGLGLDGYCCDSVDEARRKGKKKTSYIAFAVKGLLRSYIPARAAVTVDGVRTEYSRVWMVSTMKGRYYGGGFKIAPAQDRRDETRRISVVIAHDLSRLRAIFFFLMAKNGRHTGLKKNLTTVKGNSVFVEFSRPAAMQIDGEVLRDVTGYEVKT